VSTQDELLAAALAYAKRGWPVFPCIDKVPAFKGWQASATTNPATIARWYRARLYNIGVACGAGSDLLVIDDDGNEDGFLDDLPPTPTIVAKRGAKYLFRHVEGVKNSASKVATKIDVRTTGGLVVMPPSVHPDGPIYRWLVTGDPIEAPAWLIERLRAAARPSNSERALAAAGGRSDYCPNRTFTSGGAYGRAALNSEADALAATPKGQRNAALNLASFRLHQLVAGGELAESEVAHALLQACERNGLLTDDGLRQCQATIASGARAGLQHPRARAA
jgi:hypothetical protein